MEEVPSQPGTPAIEIESLVHEYDGRPVLRDVTLRIGPGEVVAYLGPNGSGKSTTMHLLTGRLQPTGGSIRLLGKDPWSERDEVRRRTAYVPEVAPLYEVLSAREQLELVASLRGLNDEVGRARANHLLETLDLGAVADRPLWSFSRGMRQRVAFASAFLEEPEVVLLDEPLYGLDVQTVLLVKEIVRELAARGRAVIYSSHLIEVAEGLATRAVILKEGEIVADGSPALLRAGRPGATLEGLFRELTVDREVEERARCFLEAGSLGETPQPAPRAAEDPS